MFILTPKIQLHECPLKLASNYVKCIWPSATLLLSLALSLNENEILEGKNFVILALG